MRATKSENGSIGPCRILCRCGTDTEGSHETVLSSGMQSDSGWAKLEQQPRLCEHSTYTLTYDTQSVTSIFEQQKLELDNVYMWPASFQYGLCTQQELSGRRGLAQKTPGKMQLRPAPSELCSVDFGLHNDKHHG
ncbi:hypothetical protein STEG23_037074 [Scotinomys teguina]